MKRTLATFSITPDVDFDKNPPIEPLIVNSNAPLQFEPAKNTRPEMQRDGGAKKAEKPTATASVHP